MTIHFEPPVAPALTDARHHARAAAGNAAAANVALGQVLDALSGSAPLERVLLKAAAGAGKSYVLKQLVAEVLEHPRCYRVAVIAFTNRQVWPLAESLGERLGRHSVCLFVAESRYDEVPESTFKHATVVTSLSEIPDSADVIVSTCHKIKAHRNQDLVDHLKVGANGTTPFDLLFVDEAWQLPHHLFDQVKGLAPITVGVGDVGQLPPLEIGANPWRGDPRHNPYRAWPTEYDGQDEATWSTELPAVWRPTAEQLPLWRAFYPEWGELHCVAAPGDRVFALDEVDDRLAAAVWRQVTKGVPVLLEVDGLPEAEAADVDLPLMGFVERLVGALFEGRFGLTTTGYDDSGSPDGSHTTRRPGQDRGDPLVAILATRNQAVDDAADAVDRLRERHALGEADLVSSTVDSWQGQTNGITVALHPLSGASTLDEFNSAFGRLAVTCTRATHGLLVVSRPGLDRLLVEAPARPGTPFGEPGNRQLPRQTHQRILATFTRGTVTVAPD
jgi:hypothetical protein